ncbi:immunoglobulin superfamily member 5 [Aplochiton taeniatus]
MHFKEGVSAQFQLEPQDVAVLQGTDARFNASLKGQWEIMTWMVQNFLVLTINAVTGPTSSPGRFSAQNYSSGDTSRWEFTIRNVSRNDSGPVTCYVQGDYGGKTAQLSVQESGSVAILGGNLTVVPQGQQTEFQCVAMNWFPEPKISWLMYGVEVNTSLYNTTSQAQGGHFNSISILRVRAASNTTVECQASIQALNTPRSSIIYLLVEIQAITPTDWTVLIAVVTSIGGFALLVLLILGIIFCWKRREEKSKMLPLCPIPFTCKGKIKNHKLWPAGLWLESRLVVLVLMRSPNQTGFTQDISRDGAWDLIYIHATQ